MIPRHSLPFGVNRIFSIILSPPHAPAVSDLEKFFSDMLGARTAVLLPNARAGIYIAALSLRAAGGLVVGPAYTCSVVHEAVSLAGVRTQTIDSAPDSFLMHLPGLDLGEPDCALIVSEVYGIPYDPASLQEASGSNVKTRIFDRAMSIPLRENMGQLQKRDIALFSFGWGKPMYAGRGGIACFHDADMGDSFRSMRDRLVVRESFRLNVREAGSTLIRSAANQRHLYGLWHQPHLYRFYLNHASSGSSPGSRFEVKSEGNGAVFPPDWSIPMAGLSRTLALANLREAAGNAELRRGQAEVYFRCLVETGVVRGPGMNALPQSHFPIGVPSGIRDALSDYLRSRGIDTSTLFPLSESLPAHNYPHAARAAREVLTLPMGPSLTLREVRMVSRFVKDGMRLLGQQRPDTHRGEQGG